MNSQRIDLNLLRTFDVLMETRSATRTARTLNKTQPGVSRDLARLRHLLADPLLVLVKGRLEPTPRALDLHPAIQESLLSFDACIHAAMPFDPASATKTFNIAAQGSLELELTPQVQALVKKQAPGVTIRWLVTQGELVTDGLDTGRLDLQIGPYAECPQHLCLEHLQKDQRMLVVRREHPVVRGPVDLDTFLSLDFLTYSGMLRKEIDLDKALLALGYRRRFPLRVSGFANTPFVLVETDCATTMPLRAARLFAKRFPLRIVELPIALPEMKYSMLWHRRHQTTPVHVWLRQQIREALRNLP